MRKWKYVYEIRKREDREVKGKLEVDKIKEMEEGEKNE